MLGSIREPSHLSHNQFTSFKFKLHNNLRVHHKIKYNNTIMPPKKEPPLFEFNEWINTNGGQNRGCFSVKKDGVIYFAKILGKLENDKVYKEILAAGRV